MRWTVLLALTLIASGEAITSGATTNAPPVEPAPPAGKPITKLQRATAEPENNSGIAGPTPAHWEGPSEADIGPVLKRFSRASKPDNLAQTQIQDNAAQLKKEKITIDKRITIEKIHDVQNDRTYRGGDNHALDYEVTYLNWGAVTQEQLKAREGHYFTISIDNDGPPADLVARFEYRQTLSKEIVRTLTQKLPTVSGSCRAYFAVVDQAYRTYGPVNSWRITILKGDTIIASSKSFIW